MKYPIVPPLLVTALLVSSLLVSCSHSTNTTLNGSIVPDTMHTYSVAGHALYWTDVAGEEDTSSATGTWKIASDSSWAILYLITLRGSGDTVYLRRDSLWHFAAKDSRSTYGWDPEVDNTADSVKIFMGFGFSGSDYLMKKL